VSELILITGGAGFIGQHLARALLERGYRVRVLDSLVEQVHGTGVEAPGMHPEVEFICGDVRAEAARARALRGVESVIHLAAEVGVGQSMYMVDRYVATNDYGTAALFQSLIECPVRRVVVASSMSIYGEGLYATTSGRILEDVVRRPRSNSLMTWDPVDDAGEALHPLPTPEWKRPALASVYAITKYVQERLTLTLAPAYGMEGVALRLWNVYGPGQALSNPYTGVLAIFASRLHNAQPPLIFEDGRQRRDFVHVQDVVQAFILALETPSAAGNVFNIASGVDRTVHEVASLLAGAMGREHLAPEVTGKMRAGDIRHCIADISLAREVLGFAPQANFVPGLTELAEWVAQQRAEDRVHHARHELEARGLVA